MNEPKDCNLVQDDGILRCEVCGWWISVESAKSLDIKRNCDGEGSRELNESRMLSKASFIKRFGAERTDAEVLYIITNHCLWCPNWIPTAPKKKCKACGCGSTETVENLHRRRIKNCPRPNEPAAWTEQLLQARMNHGGKNNS